MAIQVIENRIFQHLRDADGTAIIRKRFGIKDGQEVEIESGEKDEKTGEKIKPIFKFFKNGEEFNIKNPNWKSPYKHGLCIGSVALALSKNNVDSRALKTFIQEMLENNETKNAKLITEAMTFHKEYYDLRAKGKVNCAQILFYEHRSKNMIYESDDTKSYQEILDEFREKSANQNKRLDCIISMIDPNDKVGHVIYFVKYENLEEDNKVKVSYVFFDPAFGIFESDRWESIVGYKKDGKVLIKGHENYKKLYELYKKQFLVENKETKFSYKILKYNQ